MRIYFDRNLFERDLLAAIKNTLAKQGNEIYSQAIATLYTDKGKQDLYNDGVIFLQSLSNVMAYKIYGGADFVMDEYGTGDKMDRNNPYLEEYKRSDMWNKNRKNNAIYTRSVGTWTDIYGNKRQTIKAPKKPINLQVRWQMSEKFKMLEALVKLPSNALTRAFNDMDGNRINEFMNYLIRSLDFSKYIKVKPTKKVRKL